MNQTITYTSRIHRLAIIASGIAEMSNIHRFRHGALLYKGSRILNTSCNKLSYTKFGGRFRDANCGIPTIHAELGVILGIPRHILQGADVFVVRLMRAGHFGLSKPCEMCRAAMQHVGIRRVIYSHNKTEFKQIRL